MFIRNAINQSLLTLCTSGLLVGMGSALGFAQGTTTREGASSAAANKPRIRFVSITQCEVYAGPGEDYYPTGILSSGQSIEVHQETADGWLAITPPSGSFSWLPASQGLLLPGGRVVEVTEKSSVSWIGTSLGTAKQYRWQVKLERGQQLAVVGERTINDAASGSQMLWYKIAPPPGEYRWIQIRATSETPPDTTKSANSPDAAQSIVNDTTEPESPAIGQVVQASASQPATPGKTKRPPSKTASSPIGKMHQHSDPWADWHAVEFKNGTFSFPGLSRMLGMQPAESSNVAATADPFDLTASYSRAKPNRPRAPITEPITSEDDDSYVNESTTSTLAVRQSRGWRDPRALRQDRMRGGLRENLPEETALVINEPDMDTAEVTDAGFLEETAVGTSVITAGATESRQLRRPPNLKSQPGDEQLLDQEQAWYGIDQAPANPITVTSSSTVVAQAGLNELQLELSSMVAGPEHTWNLAPLAVRAQYYVEHGRDSLERGQARLLLERIESFSALAKQASAVGASTSNAPTRAIPASVSANMPGSTVASWVAPPSNSTTTSDNSGAKFDATGWLVPVHSNGRDMPTHALTNDAGRIIVYVTPAPGVNLTRFESQAIGVYGLRGYLPQLKTNHIQIQRVVRLQ